MDLIALQLKTSQNFEKNLSKLIKQIKSIKENTLILAPELVLTGYAYHHLEKASQLTQKASKILKFLSYNKTIAITMITQSKNHYYNTLHIFHNGKIVHTQSKAKLFLMNEEEKYFTSGSVDDIKIFKINNIKIATLICFELRFIDLWKKVQGADIILIPAMWGKQRKQNFTSLCNALAIANQCFVVASNSANETMAKTSSITSPFGKTYKDLDKKMICLPFEKEQIKQMRKKLYIGIK